MRLSAYVAALSLFGGAAHAVAPQPVEDHADQLRHPYQVSMQNPACPNPGDNSCSISFPPTTVFRTLVTRVSCVGNGQTFIAGYLSGSTAGGALVADYIHGSQFGVSENVHLYFNKGDAPLVGLQLTPNPVGSVSCMLSGYTLK